MKSIIVFNKEDVFSCAHNIGGKNAMKPDKYIVDVLIEFSNKNRRLAFLLKKNYRVFITQRIIYITILFTYIFILFNKKHIYILIRNVI